MRIEGLVRASRQVREALERGIPEGERDRFRSWVQEMVDQVEDICERYGASPEDLPGPSRDAWRFLKEVDLSRLPEPPPGAPPPVPPIRIPGIVGRTERITVRLWAEQASLRRDPVHREQVQDEAGFLADRILALAEDLGGRPAGLPSRSRSAYALLRWLSRPGNVKRYLEGLARAEAAIGPAFDGAVVVRFLPANSAWSLKKKDGWFLLRLHPGFLGVDELAWTALGRALGKGAARSAARFVRRSLKRSAPLSVLAEFDLALG